MSRTRRAGRGALAAATIAALGLLPASAAAASKPAAAPPGNSAVTQYTQTFPSASGPRQASSAKEGEGLPSPRQALGTGNARRLQERGAAGRSLARLAAATAPASGHARDARSRQGIGAAAEQGTSGAGQVIGQALGAESSGKLGLALPLILIGTVIWATLYAWRSRPRSA